MKKINNFMPKILQINPVVKNGSTGRIAEQIGVIAMENGWDSYIAYSPRPKNTSQSKLIQIGNIYDNIWHAIITRLFDMHGLGSYWATKRFIRSIKKIKPDIIHLHNIHGYYLNYKVLFQFLSQTNIPIVWTFHDFWPITGHCSYFSDVNCLKWKTICHTCPKKKYYPKSLWLDNSKNNHNLKRKFFTSVENLTIVPVSKWVESLVKESFFEKKSIKTIYNGVDLNTFYPISDTVVIKNKYCINDKFVLLGLATTWGKRKGWDDYMKLSAYLPSDCIIVLVGLNSKQLKDLPKNIIGIKRTENIQELATLYSAADIVLNISYQETFGLTTVEGFACGTPGIVYNTTASPELISPETGIIVEPGNIKQILVAIETIKSKGKEFYKTKCRERAEQVFNIQDRFKEYISLYEKLFKNSK